MSVSIIPESAPFTPEQRSWLNGFLAGWAGVVADPANNGEAIASTLMPQGEAAPAEEEEDFPWHDPALEMDERLKLAEEKPLNRKLMAAMAQLDCGACGYVCQTYSEAIAAGDEGNLTLCSPGGKETAKMLKKLVKEQGDAPASNGAANGAAAKPVESGYSRANPYSARIKSCFNLNCEGSSKHTSHVEIELGESGLDYVVGDALGVYPTNCPELVDEILAAIGAADNQEARDKISSDYCLRSVTDELLELLGEAAADPAEKSAALGLIDSDEVDNLDVLDALVRAPSAKISPEQLMDCLSPMNPRLYSIASSPAAHPGEVHLTVGRAAFKSDSRVYKGVASTMFSDRVLPDHDVRVFVHKAHGFTVPSDPNAPMVMVGPGTGIAPFRAFLEEREATAAKGKNWLFFGDQHAATDFLYEEQLTAMQEKGVLTKMSTAFSRDQDQKVYVQDRMREEGAELFAWLEEGGSFFVCGDARRMAVDVDRALHDVIAQHGGMSDDQARQYVADLKKANRYVRDVY